MRGTSTVTTFIVYLTSDRVVVTLHQAGLDSAIALLREPLAHLQEEVRRVKGHVDTEIEALASKMNQRTARRENKVCEGSLTRLFTPVGVEIDRNL